MRKCLLCSFVLKCIKCQTTPPTGKIRLRFLFLYFLFFIFVRVRKFRLLLPHCWESCSACGNMLPASDHWLSTSFFKMQLIINWLDYIANVAVHSEFWHRYKTMDPDSRGVVCSEWTDAVVVFVMCGNSSNREVRSINTCRLFSNRRSQWRRMVRSRLMMRWEWMSHHLLLAWKPVRKQPNQA